MYLFTVWGNFGGMRTLLIISSQQVNYFHILSLLSSGIGVLCGGGLLGVPVLSQFQSCGGERTRDLGEDSMPVCQPGDAHTPGATVWLRALEAGQSLVCRQDILMLAPDSSSRGAGFTHILAASLSLGPNPGPG